MLASTWEASYTTGAIPTLRKNWAILVSLVPPQLYTDSNGLNPRMVLLGFCVI